MADTKHPDEAPCSNIGAERKAPEPCTIVIFGASGDLTARKFLSNPVIEDYRLEIE